MTESLYDPGSKIRLRARFLAEGVLTDPTTVSLKVKDPAGAIITYSYPTGVTKESVGRYLKDIMQTMPGRWFYKYIAGPGGVLEATAEGSFRIREQVIP